jgi:hypothetical protein
MERALIPFRKMKHIFRETGRMIRREKAFFLAPLLITLVLLGIFVFYVGQPVIITFIYAGL